jgi:hypothetical protein
MIDDWTALSARLPLFGASITCAICVQVLRMTSFPVSQPIIRWEIGSVVADKAVSYR